MKFWGDVGTIVHFRSGPNRGKKRDRIPWKVVELNMDPETCHWSNGGKVPQYIKLEGLIKGTITHLWTCETQLDNTGAKHGN